MRMLLTASIPVETGNEGIRDGSMGTGLQQMLEMLKPECAYFTTGEDGNRTCFVVFDLPDASAMIPMLEPFFLNLNAKISIRPVMTAQDLTKGMAALQQSLSAAAR